MTDPSISLVHRVQQPSVKSAGKPPLLLLLHGVRSNEDDLIGLTHYLDDRFLIVSLRAPLEFGPGAYGWYNVEFTPKGLIYDGDEAQEGCQVASKAVGEVVQAYDADPERVYLMGFSQGAVMSLSIALMTPEAIGGAVIMSGRLLPEIASQTVADDRLQQLPILVVHGTYDTVLPIQYGREIRDFLNAKPVDLTYHEYPMAHQVSAESLADITEWLSACLDS